MHVMLSQPIEKLNENIWIRIILFCKALSKWQDHHFMEDRHENTNLFLIHSIKKIVFIYRVGNIGK
jgi:hypothetical protein